MTLKTADTVIPPLKSGFRDLYSIISLLFPSLYVLNHPPGLLSVLFFPALGLVPAVTLAFILGSRGIGNCLTISLILSLSVRLRANPETAPTRPDHLTEMFFVGCTQLQLWPIRVLLTFFITNQKARPFAVYWFHVQILCSSSKTWFAIDEMNTYSPASVLQIR